MTTLESDPLPGAQQGEQTAVGPVEGFDMTLSHRERVLTLQSKLRTFRVLDGEALTLEDFEIQHPHIQLAHE